MAVSNMTSSTASSSRRRRRLRCRTNHHGRRRARVQFKDDGNRRPTAQCDLRRLIPSEHCAYVEGLVRAPVDAAGRRHPGGHLLAVFGVKVTVDLALVSMTESTAIILLRWNGGAVGCVITDALSGERMTILNHLPNQGQRAGSRSASPPPLPRALRRRRIPKAARPSRRALQLLVPQPGGDATPVCSVSFLRHRRAIDAHRSLYAGRASRRRTEGFGPVLASARDRLDIGRGRAALLSAWRGAREAFARQTACSTLTLFPAWPIHLDFLDVVDPRVRCDKLRTAFMPSPQHITRAGQVNGYGPGDATALLGVKNVRARRRAAGGQRSRTARCSGSAISNALEPARHARGSFKSRPSWCPGRTWAHAPAQ